MTRMDRELLRMSAQRAIAFPGFTAVITPEEILLLLDLAEENDVETSQEVQDLKDALDEAETGREEAEQETAALEERVAVLEEECEELKSRMNMVHRAVAGGTN